jgi:precorrin-6B methylase 2
MTDLLRPDPVTATPDAIAIDGNARYREVAEWLTQGKQVCLTDTYGTALTLYSWLKRDVRRRRPVSDYRTSRLYRELLHTLTRTLLVPISAHRLQLKRAPEIPWLELLYPEQDAFHLPLPDVLGMNGSWQWYTRGVSYDVLEHPLHPFHGVHFTPRGEHLALFDTYLQQRAAPPASAVDVGAGAGPLTLLLLKHGVAQVEATDAHPNAIRSLHDDLERLGLRDRVALSQTDLLPSAPPTELIVFNPPWIPGEQHVTVDAGSYYAEDLFPRFFQAAANRLSPDGRLVLLFSNFAELAGLTATSPIAAEVASGGRFRVVQRDESPVGPPGKRSPQWQRELRSRERVQLWELALAAR